MTRPLVFGRRGCLKRRDPAESLAPTGPLNRTGIGAPNAICTPSYPTARHVGHPPSHVRAPIPSNRAADPRTGGVMDRQAKERILGELLEMDRRLGALVEELDRLGHGRIAARLLVARRQVADAATAALEATC